MTTNTENIASHLTRMAKQQPKALAIAVQTTTYQEWTFEELNTQCDRIAHGLKKIGVCDGARTVLMVKPSLEFFALTFALFKTKAIPVMVDPGMGIKNLKKCLDEAAPEAFIGIPKAHVARLLFRWAKPHLKTLITVGKKLFWGGVTLDHIKAKTKDPFVSTPPKSQEMAAILFTSGSTGVPKGVVYTHENFLAQVDILRDDYKIQPGERDLATFPLFALFGPALGMAAVVPDMDASQPIKTDPKKIVKAIGDYQCTNMFASPALIEVVGRHGEKHAITLQSLKRVISAGAPATPESLKRFCTLLKPEVEVLTSYGATEALPATYIGTKELLGEPSRLTEQGKGVCVGRTVNRAEIKIIRITEKPILKWDSSLESPQGQIGEIVIKGPMVTKEYFNRDLNTRLAKIRDQDGFYHRMGDLGYLDHDNRLWMCGRKSQRVITRDETHYTLCCERIFDTHPDVRRTALVPVRINKEILPLLCVELYDPKKSGQSLIKQLMDLGVKTPLTQNIRHFLFHKKFPVDVRHNAKIFREKLALWAQSQLSKGDVH